MRLTLLDYWRLARGMPPDVLVQKAWWLLVRVVRACAFRLHDRLWSSYGDIRRPEGAWTWALRPDFQALAAHGPALGTLARQAMDQQVDLLGSGLLRVVAPVRVPGVAGHVYSSPMSASDGRTPWANRHAVHRWTQALSPGYERMDWHLDFKSGFRWEASVWYQDIVYGDRPGVDVKVPWELSRCQHLPWIALHALASSEISVIVSARLAFEDQVCDFMAANPPRFGVNWCCTMDVAIRAANWALAGALFQATEAGLSPGFQALWQAALRDHGRHIVGNLEWSPGLRSNHYLANICGLLFAARALPAEPEAQAWLGFAAQALWTECELQFLPDGANFEGSTSYHRLSGEMVVFAAALLVGLDPGVLEAALQQWPRLLVARGPGPHPAACLPQPAPPARLILERLAHCVAGIERFSRAITRPDGQVVQIGDNDSGRFFKLMPAWMPDTKAGALRTESHTDHRHLIEAARALLAPAASPASVDAAVIQALCGARSIAPTQQQPETAGMVHFADFGLTLYPGKALWCAVRCGAVGQNGQGGHAHNDQLSLEVCSDGVAFIVDPGTYLYTPLPEERNRFRATAAHNTPVAELEQNGWLPGRLGLFSLQRVGACAVMEVGPRNWVGRHEGFGPPCERRLVIGPEALVGEDLFEGGFAVHWQWAPGTLLRESQPSVWLASRQGRSLQLRLDAGQAVLVEGAVSVGYGLSEPAPRLLVTGLRGRLGWCLSTPGSMG